MLVKILTALVMPVLQGDKAPETSGEEQAIRGFQEQILEKLRE